MARFPRLISTGKPVACIRDNSHAVRLFVLVTLLFPRFRWLVIEKHT